MSARSDVLNVGNTYVGNEDLTGATLHATASETSSEATTTAATETAIHTTTRWAGEAGFSLAVL